MDKTIQKAWAFVVVEPEAPKLREWTLHNTGHYGPELNYDEKVQAVELPKGCRVLSEEQIIEALDRVDVNRKDADCYELFLKELGFRGEGV